MGEEA
ncbi:hypothetical protein BN1723_021043, partial [Verticillium longisporum]